MGERLETFIKYKELGFSEFARRIDATRQEVNNWTKGTKMGLNRISTVMKIFPELNIHWFISGTGEMLNEFDIKGKVVIPVKKCTDKICIAEKEEMQNKILMLNEKIIELQSKIIEIMN